MRLPGAGDVSASAATVDKHSSTALFDAYCLDKKPAASTINRWRVVFTTLDAQPEPITDSERAQQWLDDLVGTGTPSRKHRTVRDVWLSAARTVFAWAVRKRRVVANPFARCTVEVPRIIQIRETEKEFTEAEAQAILRASLLVEIPDQGARGAEWAWGLWGPTEALGASLAPGFLNPPLPSRLVQMGPSFPPHGHPAIDFAFQRSR